MLLFQICRTRWHSAGKKTKRPSAPHNNDDRSWRRSSGRGSGDNRNRGLQARTGAAGDRNEVAQVGAWDGRGELVVIKNLKTFMSNVCILPLLQKNYQFICWVMVFELWLSKKILWSRVSKPFWTGPGSCYWRKERFVSQNKKIKLYGTICKKLYPVFFQTRFSPSDICVKLRMQFFYLNRKIESPCIAWAYTVNLLDCCTICRKGVECLKLCYSTWYTRTFTELLILVIFIFFVFIKIYSFVLLCVRT